MAIIEGHKVYQKCEVPGCFKCAQVTDKKFKKFRRYCRQHRADRLFFLKDYLKSTPNETPQEQDNL